MIENQSLKFIQTAIPDTTYGFFFESQTLICELKTEKILLTITELLSVESDSIYVSASYQKFNSKGVNIGKDIKLNRLAICKTALSGVIISPSKEEMKKGMRRMTWFMGGLTVIITTLQILFPSQ